MLAHPQLLQAHLSALNDESVVVLGYRFLASQESQLPDAGRGWSQSKAWKVDEREPYFRQALDMPDWGCLYAHNFSISADRFTAVGGFDNDFEGCGGEDVELGYRLHCAGATFVLARSAVAVHQYHERSPQRWRDNVANLARLVAKHPELAPFGTRVRAGWSTHPDGLAALRDAGSG